MAAVYSTIRKADYNGMQNQIARVLGDGVGQYGYGQIVLSSQVVEGDKVSVEQFAQLRYDILNAYDHLNATTPSNVDEQTVRDKIRYSGTDEPVDYWLSVVNGIVGDARNLAINGRRRSTNHGTVNETWPGSYGSEWTDLLQATTTVSFSSASQARYFFNSGSTIDFTSSRAGGSSTQQNTSWTNLLSAAGTVKFGGNYPGTGVSPLDGANFYRLTNAYNSPFATFTASSPYALNSWRLFARCLDVTNNSTGTSKELEFLIQWIDDHEALGGPTETGTPVVPGGFGPDAVDGTISLNCTTVEATGTLVPASSGNFVIETPTVFVGGIAP